MQNGVVLLQLLPHLHQRHQLLQLQLQETQELAMTDTAVLQHQLAVFHVIPVATVAIAVPSLVACQKISVLGCATEVAMPNGVVQHPRRHLQHLQHHRQHLQQAGRQLGISYSAMEKML